MGEFSAIHWMVVLAIVLLLFMMIAIAGAAGLTLWPMQSASRTIFIHDHFYSMRSCFFNFYLAYLKKVAPRIWLILK